jgi:hypothetical protein
MKEFDEILYKIGAINRMTSRPAIIFELQKVFCLFATLCIRCNSDWESDPDSEDVYDIARVMQAWVTSSIGQNASEDDVWKVLENTYDDASIGGDSSNKKQFRYWIGAMYTKRFDRKIKSIHIASIIFPHPGSCTDDSLDRFDSALDFERCFFGSPAPSASNSS